MMTFSSLSGDLPPWVKLIAMASLLTVLGGCGMLGTDKMQTGSLYHTYSLMDEQGRMSGTLVTSPLGHMDLRDADGKLVGRLVPDKDIKEPVPLSGEN